MEADVLQAELERILAELERSATRLGEASRGAGELCALLEGAAEQGRDGPPAEDMPQPQVVTNVPQGRLHNGLSGSDALDTVKLRPRDVAQLEPPEESQGTSGEEAERPGSRPGGQEPRGSGRVERPAGRTLPGPGPDSVETARVLRPGPVGEASAGEPGSRGSGRVERPAGRTLPGPGPDLVDTARVPRPGPPTDPSAGAVPPDEGDPDGLGEEASERPTGQYQRPQRDTKTYFFGVDGPAPDEETELGPVGGSPSKRLPDP